MLNKYLQSFVSTTIKAIKKIEICKGPRNGPPRLRYYISA